MVEITRPSTVNRAIASGKPSYHNPPALGNCQVSSAGALDATKRREKNICDATVRLDAIGLIVSKLVHILHNATPTKALTATA